MLLYCWHAYATMAGVGFVFAVMNYAVHAVMYSYFALATLKVLPGWFPAWCVTLAQIAQMVHTCTHTLTPTTHTCTQTNTTD